MQNSNPEADRFSPIGVVLNPDGTIANAQVLARVNSDRLTSVSDGNLGSPFVVGSFPNFTAHPNGFLVVILGVTCYTFNVGPPGSDVAIQGRLRCPSTGLASFAVTGQIFNQINLHMAPPSMYFAQAVSGFGGGTDFEIAVSAATPNTAIDVSDYVDWLALEFFPG